jgi:ribosome biogenesis GTPase
MKLHELGFDPWFEAVADEFRLNGCGFARVSAVDRGFFRILDEFGEVQAELSGKLAFQANSATDLPCTGDWVIASFHDGRTAAVIHRVFPRKSFLRRKAAGQTVGFQMIAANIDTAFLVQSCHVDFNPRRLDRYLVMAAEGNVEPVVVLTKTDLIPRDQLEKQVSTIHSATNARVITLSNVTGIGFDTFQETLTAGKTYCLLGSSGVGKTTIVNRLMGRDAFATQKVSGTGEGIHTTSRRQLIVLPQGALLMDTPGMRELGVAGAAEGIETGFEEIAALAEECRYADCGHEHEPGCAVRAAMESGELGKDRYFSYIKLKKEANYFGMSSLEKRQKEKTFGRFMKSVKKRMKK